MFDLTLSFDNGPEPEVTPRVLDTLGRRGIKATFFVIDPRNGKRADVGVVRPAGRAAYLRTHADGDWNDNLLFLDHCSL